MRSLGLCNSFSSTDQKCSARYTGLLNWLDPTVAASLESKSIDPALYVFRWITTLFSTSFSLPDTIRLWDRLLSLYPSPLDPPEALSPLLGHLLDLSIALVLHERPTLVSPFANFQKCIMVLQDPHVEGEDVDRMLGVAWEIRERRLGRSKGHQKTDSGTWRAAASKWTTGPAAVNLRQRFWAVAAPAEVEPPVLAGGERLEGKVLQIGRASCRERVS